VPGSFCNGDAHQNCPRFVMRPSAICSLEVAACGLEPAPPARDRRMPSGYPSLSMKKCAWLVVSGIVACFAGCGDDEDDAADALEVACEKLCDATFSGECPIAGLDVDQCKRACPYLDEQLGGYCVPEYTTALECTVDGGFTCTENGPLPNEPCPEPNQALVECTAKASCQRYCKAAASEGCPPGGTISACVSDCNEIRDALGVCSTRYDLYLQCSYSFGLTCSAGEPTSEVCDEDLVDIGACLASNVDACEGYCFSTELLGCDDAAACMTSCESSRDADAGCTQAYEDWLECVVVDFEPSCDGGQLDASGCDYDRGVYESCLMGG